MRVLINTDTNFGIFQINQPTFNPAHALSYTCLRKYIHKCTSDNNLSGTKSFNGFPHSMASLLFL